VFCRKGILQFSLRESKDQIHIVFCSKLINKIIRILAFYFRLKTFYEAYVSYMITLGTYLLHSFQIQNATVTASGSESEIKSYFIDSSNSCR